MSFQTELQLLREKIINRTLFISTLFIGIALIPSLLRIYEVGIQFVLFFHIAGTILLIILYSFRNSISTNIKAHTFLLIVFILSIVGIINFRIAGAAYLIIMVIIVSLLIYGVRIGLIYSICFTLIFIFIAYLHINGIITFNIDFNVYSKSKTAWFALITGYIFSFVVLIDITSLYYKLFMGTLKESINKTEELNQKNYRLQLTEKRYRSLFEGSKDGIILVDKDFKILDCNPAYLEIVGYKLEELLGTLYSYGLTDKNFDWDNYFMSLAKKTGENKRVELITIHKDGTGIPIEATPHFIEDDSEVFMWGIIRDLREKKNLEKKIFSTMIKAEEKERERYAKELHDGLGPLLSTGLIYINALATEKDNNTIKEYSNRAYDILKEATAVIKEISNNLSPVILSEYGISQAVRSFIEKTQQVTQIQFSIIDNLTKRLPQIIEFTLYRTLVELVNNSLKYSRAKKVSISFVCQQQKILISYEDNGEGFDYANAINNNSGFGLLNLENRIKKIGGKYQYNTSPGNGVKVTIELMEECE